MEKEINKACNCKKECTRHGKCDECIEHHLKIKTKTSCQRKNKALGNA